MRQRTPLGYEEKFTRFVCACEKAKAEGILRIIITQPQALGGYL
jgi:hypothetical protein